MIRIIIKSVQKTNQMKKYLIFKKWYKQVDKHGLKFLVVLFIRTQLRSDGLTFNGYGETAVLQQQL